MINPKFTLTRSDMEKVFKECVGVDKENHEWILDFVCDDKFETDIYGIIGAKNKGGSFRCCARLLYQLVNNDKEGVIIRHNYTGHGRTVREIRKLITLIEKTTGKMISRVLSLPSINTTNYNCRFIRYTPTDKSIYFLAMEDPNGMSNMSGIQEVFIEEFVKINIYANYEKFNQVARENLEIILNNFSRFENLEETSNTYLSVNPHDPNYFMIKRIYGEGGLFDFSDEKLIKKLETDTTVVGVMDNFCGRSWTIRHCSVYSNWLHITNQAKKQINNYLNTEWKKEDCLFMVWGFPRPDRKSGWLFRYNLDLINQVDNNEFLPFNLRCGLDIGKNDKTVLCVCADNKLDFSEIVVIKIFTIKHNTLSPTQKIGYLLEKYLQFLKGSMWWKQYRYNLNIKVGCDDYWIKDVFDNIINSAGIPLKLNFMTIPKSSRGMLLTNRHLTLQGKIINSKIKYTWDSEIKLLVEELRETLYDGDKIIDRGGNDVKDAFFYANDHHFLFSKLDIINLNKPIVAKRHLRLSI